MDNRTAIGPTAQEFEAVPAKPWEVPICKHCGEIEGYHWQTPNGRVWCTQWRTDSAEGDPK